MARHAKRVHGSATFHHDLAQSPTGPQQADFLARRVGIDGVRHAGHPARYHLLVEHGHGQVRAGHLAVCPVFQTGRVVQPGQDLLKAGQQLAERNV